MPKADEFLVFCLGQAVCSQTLGALGGFDPVTDTLGGRFELMGEVFGGTSSPDEFDDMLPVLRWIGWV